MSRPDLVREIVARTRREQGLPARVTDPATLSKVAGVMRLGEAPAETVGLCGALPVPPESVGA